MKSALQKTTRKWEAFLDWWFGPKDVLSLRWFESFLVGSMLYYFYGYLQTPEWWLTDTGFHMSAAATSRHYIPPPPLPPVEWLNGIMIALYFLGGLYLMGYGRRVLNWVFLAVCIYVQAMDQPSAFTINRMFIVSFFFLGLQPREETIRGKRVVSGWIVRVFQLTLMIQYTAAGICKFYWGDWLSRNDIVWTQAQGHYKNELAAWAINDLPTVYWVLLTWFSLGFETLAVFLFAWRKSRHATVVLGVLFHLGIAMLMKDLIYFSLQMLTAYVFFVDPKVLHRVQSYFRRLGESV